MKFDSLGWLDAAIEIDYLNKSMDRQGYTPKFIVLHGTAGGTSAQAIANYFAGSAEASAHFVIGTDGAIVQGINVALAAWANGPIDGTPADNLGFRAESDGVHRDSWWDPNVNPNFLTISIEHCKAASDNSDALTPAQQDASFKLIACICDTYGIPQRFADSQGGITGHFSMSALERQHCPGPYPWQDLFTYLQGVNTPMPIPTNWKDDGKTLTAPNNVPVALGFRDYVLKNNWNKDNWPLETEQHCDPLEHSNLSLGAGQRQRFRWITLEYTAKMGVFEAWTGPELLWYQQQLTQITKEIAALKANIGASNLQQINALA